MTNHINYFKYPYKNVQDKDNVFSPIESLSKGTAFKDIYRDYRGYRPVAIKTGPTEKGMLHSIQANLFYLIDLGMHLDTHPHDDDILSKYNRANSDLRKDIELFEKKYGPLTLASDVHHEKGWKWLNMWPWERGSE